MIVDNASEYEGVKIKTDEIMKRSRIYCEKHKLSYRYTEQKVKNDLKKYFGDFAKRTSESRFYEFPDIQRTIDIMIGVFLSAGIGYIWKKREILVKNRGFSWSDLCF